MKYRKSVTRTAVARLGVALAAATWLAACTDSVTGREQVPPSAGASLDLEHLAFDLPREPSALLVTPTSFVVSDVGNGQVMVFDRAGKFQHALGSRGNAPGQLIAPADLALVHDSLVAVFDRVLQRVTVYALGTPRFVGSYELPGVVGSLHDVGDSLLMGAQDLNSHTSFQWLGLRDSAVRIAGPLPPALRNPSAVTETYPLARAVPTKNGVRVAFTGANVVYSTDLTGTLRDSVSPPVVHRLGIPADLETRLKQKDSLVAPASVLSLMEALPDGRTALVYMDLVRKGSNVGLNVWLSTLDANGHPSCADLRIPVSEYSRPAFGVHGDTLFVLQRAPKAQGGAVISTIARWIVPRC